MQESIYSLESFVNFISVGLAEKSVKSYEKVVEHFFEFMEARGKSPADLERVDLTDYILALKNRGLSPSFINTNFAGIKKYYRYLVKNKAFEKILFLDIFDDVDRPKIVFNNQKVYEKQDVEKILKIYEKNIDNLIGFGNYVFLLIMSTTGGRCGETANLKVGDIDFGTNHITFFNTKNRKPRAVKMCDYLAETLAKYLQMRANCVKDGSDYLFLDKRGCKTNTDAISARIRDYGRKHGLKISFHPFRRGYASELANSGVPIEKISKILGHSSLSVTATHYIYSRDLDEAALAYNLFNNRTFDNRIIDDRQIDNKLTLKQSIANTKAMFENETQKQTQLNTINNTNTNTVENTEPNTFTENTLRNNLQNTSQNVNDNTLQNFTENNTNNFTNKENTSQNVNENNLQNFTQNNTNTFTENFTKDNINILEILSSLTAEVCDLKSLLQKPLTS